MKEGPSSKTRRKAATQPFSTSHAKTPTKSSAVTKPSPKSSRNTFHRDRSSKAFGNSILAAKSFIGFNLRQANKPRIPRLRRE